MQAIRDAVLDSVNVDEIVDLLQQMIRRPSRNPPGDERECAEFLASWLGDAGFEVKLIAKPYEHRPQVVAWLRGQTSEKSLILNGHLDVVPEVDPAGWSCDPFGGELRDGRVWGRGSCDMKGGIACSIGSALALRRAGAPLKGDLIIMAAVGEETAEPGTRTLVTECGITADWGIVTEPTELRVASAARGAAWFNIVVVGNPSPVSNPVKGINSIRLANKALSALETYKSEIGQKSHALCPNASIEPTIIRAGLQANIIPPTCTITVDRRLLPGETWQMAEGELRELLDGVARDEPQFRYELHYLSGFESAEISPEHELVGIMQRNIANVLGSPQPLWGTPYASDVRNFINDAGFPGVTFGPGDIANAHGFDEYVPVVDLERCAKVLCLTALDLLS